MDPVGPWSACATSYNSLAGATGLNASASDIHHQLAASGNSGSMNQSGAGSSSNTQQQARSLLQAAHGNPSPSSANVSSFNVGGFLSPNNYGSVFSSFFQANPKVALNNVSSSGTSERQTSKHDESKIDLPYIRDNPSLAHPIGSSFYSHSPSVSSTPSTPWSQGNSQYPSPFGLLPHETSSKSLYENAFSTNFLSAQAVNQLNTQSRGFLDDSRNDSKKSSCHSPQVALPKTTASHAANYSSVNSSFYQQSNNRAYSPASENARRSTHYPQQTCPTTTSVTSTNPNRHVPGISSKSSSSVAGFSSLSSEKASAKTNLTKSVSNKVQSEPPSKVYTELRSVDARNVIESNKSSSSKPSFQKMPNCRPGPTNFSLSPCSSGSVSSDSQRMQCAQRSVTQQNPTGVNYSHFTSPGSCSETDFLVNNSRNKTMSVSGDSPYSSSSSQNGSDCSVNTSKRISPHVNQVSPGRHITNPAYSLYSNTMSSLTSPNTLQHQQLSDPASNFLNGNYATKQSTPISPQDSSNLRPVGHNYSNSSAYPSAIANAKSYNSPEFSSKACWNSPEQSSRGNFPNDYSQDTGFGSHVQSRAPLSSNEHRPLAYHDNQGSSQISYQDLNSSRISSINAAKNLSAAELNKLTMEKKNMESEMRRSPVRGTKSGKKKRKSSEASDLSAQSAFVHSHSSEVSPHSSGIQPYPYPYYDYGRWNAPNPQKLFNPGFESSFVPQFANRAADTQQNQLLSLQQYQNAQFLSHRPTLHSLSPVSQKQLNDRTVKHIFETGGGSDSSKVIVPDVDEELGHLAGGIPSSKDSDPGNPDVASSKNADNSSGCPNNESTEKRIISLVEKSIVPVAKLSPKIASSGFIGSFLKFLQGEKEPSPPPTSRPPRAKLYQPPEPPKKPAVTSTVNPNVDQPSTNDPSCPTATSTKPKSVTINPPSQPAIDPRDDLRYFPLPKSRKSLNSSSEDSDSETTPKAAPKTQAQAPKNPNNKPKEVLPKKKYYIKKADRIPPQEPKKKEVKDKDKDKDKEAVPKKKLKPAPGEKLKKKSKKTRRKGESSDEISDEELKDLSSNSKGYRENLSVKVVIKDVKNEKNGEKPIKQKNCQDKKTASSKSQTKEVSKDASQNLPRRETAGRRAKEKTNIILAMKDEDFDLDDPNFTDSDEDPAWTPKHVKVEESDEEEKKKHGRKKLRLAVNLTKKSSHLIEDSSSDHESDASAQSSKKRKSSPTKATSNIKGISSSETKPKSDKTLAATSTKSSVDKKVDVLTTNSNTEAPKSSFSNGDFVIVKSDVPLDHPPLWRADGKMLLQKFESFEKNGEWLHKNISTFSGWTPHNKHNYEPVTVKIRQVTKMETIVEFIRPTGKYTAADNQKIEELMKTTSHFQDNFEVYIQTLISQALDSSFLKEILSEKDEYFLTSVNAIDEITLEKTKKIIRMLNWKSDLITSLQTYPCFNELTNLSQKDRESKMCVGCSSDLLMYRVMLYGQPYDNVTLAGASLVANTSNNKDFLICQDCDGKLRILNKAAHQKYLMFMESSKRVVAKKAEDTTKDTAVILNELLADEEWLQQLFKKVQRNWAEIDFMEMRNKSKGTAAAVSLPRQIEGALSAS